MRKIGFSKAVDGYLLAVGPETAYKSWYMVIRIETDLKLGENSFYTHFTDNIIIEF